MAYRGMGEQPGYVCFDPNRPAWFPNWLDTWNESTCKFQNAGGNIVACLNPASTQCSEDSWVNFNVLHGKLNPDPTLPGPGIAAPGEPTNAPPGLVDTVTGLVKDQIPDLTFDPGNLILWIGIGAVALFYFGRR